MLGFKYSILGFNHDSILSFNDSILGFNDAILGFNDSFTLRDTMPPATPILFLQIKFVNNFRACMQVRVDHLLITFHLTTHSNEYIC